MYELHTLISPLQHTGELHPVTAAWMIHQGYGSSRAHRRLHGGPIESSSDEGEDDDDDNGGNNGDRSSNVSSNNNADDLIQRGGRLLASLHGPLPPAPPQQQQQFNIPWDVACGYFEDVFELTLPNLGASASSAVQGTGTAALNLDTGYHAGSNLGGMPLSPSIEPVGVWPFNDSQSSQDQQIPLPQQQQQQQQQLQQQLPLQLQQQLQQPVSQETGLSGFSVFPPLTLPAPQQQEQQQHMQSLDLLAFQPQPQSQQPSMIHGSSCCA